MIRHQQERAVSVNENMRGGNGTVTIEHILAKDDMNDKGRLFARIILKPGCSIGYHTHENESETFYVVKGTATYDDNGTPTQLKPGDMSYTPAGSGHSVANNGDEDVELIALILY